jgi:hypothetical protein
VVDLHGRILLAFCAMLAQRRAALKPVRGRKEESSFSVEKEAKRLSSICAVFWCSGGRKRMKVFWFFFSKKNRFLTCPLDPFRPFA